MQQLNKREESRSVEKLKKKQDHQALVKAKYGPRVAAASGTQKNTQKPMWPWPLTDDLET